MMAIVAWYESFDHLESLLSKLHTPQKVEISGKSPFSSIFIIAGIRRVKARCAKWAGVEWFNVQCCFVSAEFSGAEFFLGCGCHVGCVCSLFSRVWHLIHELRSLEGKQLGKLWWRCWGKGPRFKLRWCSRSVTKLRSPLLNLLQSSNKSVCLDERRRDVERQVLRIQSLWNVCLNVVPHLIFVLLHLQVHPRRSSLQPSREVWLDWSSLWIWTHLIDEKDETGIKILASWFWTNKERNRTGTLTFNVVIPDLNLFLKSRLYVLPNPRVGIRHLRLEGSKLFQRVWKSKKPCLMMMMLLLDIFIKHFEESSLSLINELQVDQNQFMYDDFLVGE